MKYLELLQSWMNMKIQIFVTLAPKCDIFLMTNHKYVNSQFRFFSESAASTKINACIFQYRVNLRISKINLHKVQTNGTLKIKLTEKLFF